MHPARDLDELLSSIEAGPARVRACLGDDRLSYGLWMSEAALAQSCAEQHTRLRAALQKHQLDVWTMNAFPLGNFHAPVVKYDVYRPHWAEIGRSHYTMQCAELLTLLLAGNAAGTISTLPIGYREDFEDPQRLAHACDRLCETALALQELASRSQAPIRLCLEPEPGCVLETGNDVVRFWNGALADAALRCGAQEAIRAHLGICLDTCHHAVAFEDPEALLIALHEAQIPIGKVQLSSAVSLDSSDSGALAAMRALDEERFLHQVRARQGAGKISGCDDLSEVDTLASGGTWRVHFHVPIHQEKLGLLDTTQEFMNQIMQLLPDEPDRPQFEVETYTWNVLPVAERPKTQAELAQCIAKELQYAREHLR